ncbi:DUF202 domain-containing protein [Nocardia jiangxiensis]|uniref:DUF202 domain-containing protein n=1 Tax=Nocardia jiangxiensis TaxID=282685 RepID=A0ABW6S243_9NOCA|nr:DUF202 domain-containing protein [Nocardia jiangxiensis]
MTPDTGMARERTALSWRRTAVASMATAALFVNHAVVSGWRHSAAAPLVAALMLIVLATMSFQRSRALHHGELGRSRIEVTLTATVVVLVCAVALLIGLSGPPR